MLGPAPRGPNVNTRENDHTCSILYVEHSLLLSHTPTIRLAKTQCKHGMGRQLQAKRGRIKTCSSHFLPRPVHDVSDKQTNKAGIRPCPLAQSHLVLKICRRLLLVGPLAVWGLEFLDCLFSTVDMYCEFNNSANKSTPYSQQVIPRILTGFSAGSQQVGPMGWPVPSPRWSTAREPCVRGGQGCTLRLRYGLPNSSRWQVTVSAQ